VKQTSVGKTEFSKKILTKREALQLLDQSGCSISVKAHCRAVSKQAVRIAKALQKKGYKIDLKFVETASLLHDIGRSRTHGIRHGIEGARILKDYPRYARACERHIGAGIDKKEAKKLGLPVKNYIPITLEEKIITHADNITEGGKAVPIKETINAYEKKLGKNHPATIRLTALSKQMENMLA
jgi:uncharacterized protein